MNTPIVSVQRNNHMSDHELISTLLGSMLSAEPTTDPTKAQLALEDALWVSYENELDAARPRPALTVVPKEPLFELGRLLITPGALALLERLGLSSARLIDRHVSGDEGEKPFEDHVEDDEDHVVAGLRVFSCYKLNGANWVWVITEADRSATTILLPEEY
jgi:hypothetical protein